MRLLTNAKIYALKFLLAAVLLACLDEIASARERYDLTAEMPVSYYIQSELDTINHILAGREEIGFLNPSDKALDVFIFHLYPNAFKDTTTLMARESDLMKQKIAANPGYINCDSIYIDNLPPDSFKAVETLLYIYPHYQLPPGRIAAITMKFIIKIPPTVYRFGYDLNGNYLISHWHPIMVGFQKGKPIIFQYGAYGEFFSNFSAYEIELKLPLNFKLGSTSNINTPDSSISGSSYYTLKVRNVIDFAFACGPAWEIESFFYNNIAIDIFYRKENVKSVPDVKDCLEKSLAYFGDLLYPYPYPNFVCIDFNADNAGMELPRMIVLPFDRAGGGQHWDIKNTIVHETSHQWFYATIASNEYDEAWLDEGFVSYLTDRALTRIYGEAVQFNFLGIEESYSDISALSSRLFLPLNALETGSEDFYEGYYFRTVYSRALVTIKALETMLTAEVFDRALKDYAAAYKFKYPDSYDLLRSFENSATGDLGWFFDSYVFGTDRVDYEVSSIKSARVDSLYKTTVTAIRNHNGVLPQELVVGYEDGTFGAQRWDGQARYHEFEFISTRPVMWAAVDTAYGYLLDEDFANNSLKISPNTSTTLALSGGVGFLVQLFLLIIGAL